MRDDHREGGRLAETRAGKTSSSRPAPSEPELVEGGLIGGRLRLRRELGTGGMSRVWMAEHLGLGIDVAVKLLRSPANRTSRERFSREAQLAGQIDHPHAVRVLDHGQTDGGTPFIVMELLAGESLAQRLSRAGPLSLDEVTQLVRQIADVLTLAHARGIVHRDIKPDNVMLLADRTPLFAKVVDFGIAKPMGPAEITQVTDDGHLVGTPLYMAPEQLFDGRPADAGSDLWGLALVAYEALVGRRPFDGPTRAAVGYAIVTRRFAPPSEARPELPESLDALFERALRLEPEERHETAEALARALEEAAREPRTPATGRGAHRLRIPDRLYGRKPELAALRAAFDRASAGRSEVALVAGLPGTGKSTLVAHARRELFGASGQFVSGKFDQFDRGTPYRSLVQALRQLVRRSLAHRTDVTAEWRRRLSDALGEGGRALVAVIPELEAMYADTSPTDDLPPEEARNRFRSAVRRLAAAMASAEQPLVVFLDDLQWADDASIDVIGDLATDPESRHVLLIGAYRDDEVGATHPLAACIERMRARGAALTAIPLGPLGDDAVLDLVSDTFGGASGRARLAAACRNKTLGNAFFLRRFLEVLHEEGAVRFDRDTDRWTFDLDAIEARAMSEEVLDFVLAELRRLPASTREALEIASCLGERFDLTVLAVALGVEPTEALERLRPALACELVVPPADQPFAEASRRRAIELSFAHDRIRQAARASMSAGAAAGAHRVAALYLFEHLDGEERDRRLFEIVDHLNRGFVGDVGPVDAARLRATNLAAARRAMASAAFERAHVHFAKARSHVGADAWTTDYEQTIALHIEGARAAYLSRDDATRSALVEVAVQNARGVLDRTAAREVTIQAMVSQQRFHDAIALAVEALDDLGESVPREPTAGDVEAAVGGTLAALLEQPDGWVARAPRVDDPRVTAIQRIQNGTMSSAYLAAPNLLPILASRIVRSTVEHGIGRESPYGFAVFALVLTAADHIDAAYATGKIAEQLLERVGHRALRAKTLHVLAAHVFSFVDALPDAIERDRRVVRVGGDTGDLEYAAWALHCMVCNGFYAGVALPSLAEMYAQHHALLEHQGQLAALGCTLQYGQAIRNLVGDADDPLRLVGPEYDEERHMAELETIGFRGAAFILTTVATFVRFLFGDHAGAVERADRGAAYADGATATYHLVWWHQYRTLARLALVDRASPEEIAAALDDVAPSVDRLRRWHGFSPVNHDHRLHLIEAELARVEGRHEDAMERLASAVAAARENGFVHEEAIALERLATLHAHLGDIARADAHRREAGDAFARWGATAKAERLLRP